MEDSAKRRERLQAMRMEASSPIVEGPSPSASDMRLSNPLVHPTVVSLESSPPPHRFDYYTDPTSAYATVKRKTSDSSGGDRHGDFFRLPTPSTPNSAARLVAGQMEYHMSSHPRQLPSPSPSYYDSPWSRPHCDLWKSPVQHPSPTTGNTGANKFLRHWNMPGNSSGHGYISNASQGSSACLNRGQSPISSSAYSARISSGRGQQFWGESPSPVWNSGRGRGHHSAGYGSGRRLKSMLKDPWRKLKPVIGNILTPLSRPQSFLPKSIAAKKVKVDKTAIDFKSGQSFAELLALAFEETVSDQPKMTEEGS